MTNYVGKTKEFAEEIVNYYINRRAMPDPVGLYVTLLSAVPTPAGSEPYDATAIKAVEASAGAFRAPLPAFGSFTTQKSQGLSAMTATTNVGAAIDFPVVPGAPSDTLVVSGYALVRGATNLDPSAYVGYEIFDAPGNRNKQRSAIGGDTIRINAQGFTILEK